MSDPRVSIVIVSFNTVDLLDACLGSIAAQTLSPHEVIVVDNNSADGSAQMVRERHPGVLVIENRRNAGFAGANNQGFELARGELVLMLNPDTVVLDRAVDRLADYMDVNPRVGAVAAMNLNADLSLQYSCHHFPTFLGRVAEYSQLRRVFPKAKAFGKANMTYWDYAQAREVDWATGACLMLRRKALEDVGLLDAEFFLYTEEVDWCRRARDKGWPTVFLPEARIIHHYGASAQKQDGKAVFGKNISEHLYRTQYRYFRKHHGQLYSWGVRAVDFVFAAALYLKNLPRPDGELRRGRLARSRKLMQLALSGGR